MSVESDTVSLGESCYSSEERRGTCEVASCYKQSSCVTPCCHERVCDDHYEELVVPVCDVDGCSYNEEKICTQCQGINGEYCDNEEHLK